MGVTVTANDRTVVHHGSNGYGLAFPDICFTPPGKIPIPYPNLVLSKDADGTCATIFCDGYPVMNAKSFFARSYLDEPGTGGGIVSGCNMGKGSFYTASPDVFFEGAPAPRHNDGTLQNHGSPANVISAFLQVIDLVAIRVKLCIIVCFCNEPGFKTWCLRKFLSTPTPVLDSRGRWSIGYDPTIPNIWVEVSYDNQGNYISSWTPSRWQTDETGRPLNVPAGMDVTATMRGSARPDVIVTKNKHAPPTPDNILKIYEVKFDDDPRAAGAGLMAQIKKYKAIGPTEVLDAKSCGCKPPAPPLPPITLPIRQRKPVPMRAKVGSEYSVEWGKAIAIGAGAIALGGIVILTGGAGAAAGAIGGSAGILGQLARWFSPLPSP